MSDHVELKDLRKRSERGWVNVTVSDLVEALQGRVFSAPRPTSGPWLEPGDYLIVRLEDE